MIPPPPDRRHLSSNEQKHHVIFMMCRLPDSRYYTVITYRSGNYESREEVPESVESVGYDVGYVVIRSQSHGHHSVEHEVEQREEHEIQEPEEFSSCPVETDHCIHNRPEYDCLGQTVRDFDDHLQSQNMTRMPLCVPIR